MNKRIVLPKISGQFCMLLVLMILLVPLPWICSMLLAAAWHECCHYLAIRWLGGSVSGFSVRTRMAAMQMEDLSPGKAALAALAGPLGSFMLLLLWRVFPRLAFCAAVQGLYNLLPMYPMDGGRVYAYWISRFLSTEHTEIITKFTTITVKIAFVFLGIYATFSAHLGLFPLLLAVFVCCGHKREVLTNYERRSTIHSLDNCPANEK